jgi:hypothetical protein
MPTTGDDLSIGQTAVLDETDELVISITRISGDDFLASYNRKEDGEAILTLTFNRDKGTADFDEEAFDSSFWTLTLDGEEIEISELPSASVQANVKHEERTIEVETRNAE